MFRGDSQTARQVSLWRDSAIRTGCHCRRGATGGRCAPSTLTGASCHRQQRFHFSADACVFHMESGRCKDRLRLPIFPTHSRCYVPAAKQLRSNISLQHALIHIQSFPLRANIAQKKTHKKYKETELRNPDLFLYFDPLIIPWFIC